MDWMYNIDVHDTENTFISTDCGNLPDCYHATVLYAGPYVGEPEIGRLNVVRARYKKWGYSCHSPLTSYATVALNMGCHAVEKHFTLEKNMKWNGVIFRDTVHGATPKEFELITKGI